jgi:hypothetical protein
MSTKKQKSSTRRADKETSRSSFLWQEARRGKEGRYTYVEICQRKQNLHVSTGAVQKGIKRLW